MPLAGNFALHHTVYVYGIFAGVSCDGDSITGFQIEVVDEFFLPVAIDIYALVLFPCIYGFAIGVRRGLHRGIAAFCHDLILFALYFGGSVYGIAEVGGSTRRRIFYPLLPVGYIRNVVGSCHAADITGQE